MPSHQKVTAEGSAIGTDIRKTTFHLIGQDRRGKIVMRARLSRSRFMERLASVLRCRFSRIVSIGYDPIDIDGSRIGARLDAPVALLEGGSGDELVGRCITEIALDIALQRCLIALEGDSQPWRRDGNGDLAAHGVDGDERELPVRGQLIKRIGGVC
jgi:hypothetical protein